MGAQPGAGAVGRGRGEERDEDVETIEEDQLGVFRQIGDLRIVGREVLLRGDPADVRPPEAVYHGGVLIFLFVRVLVVVTVGAGPPEGASLDGESGPDGHHELEGAGRGVGLVGEVTVEEARDGEHPEEVEADGRTHGDRADADPDDPETGQMEDDEGNGTGPIYLLLGALQGFDSFRDVVRIEPADQGTEKTVRRRLGRRGGHLFRR